MLTNLFIRQARKHVSDNKELDLDAFKLCADIFTVLRSGETDDEIQILLVELLGYESLDLIADLISNRPTIVHNIIRMSDYDEQAPKGRAPANTERRPVYGTQFTIQSEKELKEEKKLRKEQKRAMKHKTEGRRSLFKGFKN